MSAAAHARQPKRTYHLVVAESRECVQCGTPFTPGREHARFCSAACRMTWNQEHAGVAATPDVAIDWSVTAMTEAVGRLTAAEGWDLARVATALGETVWWITLVDATLVRYHPEAYERTLASKTVRRYKTEQTLAGLRYVRNELGRSADPAMFIQCGSEADVTAWTWRALAEPILDAFTARARQWEMNRYRAYQARLATNDVGRTLTRCTDFLAQAAALATTDQAQTKNAS
jgi:hypothetical protein